jgi:hypothetical protein
MKARRRRLKRNREAQSLQHGQFKHQIIPNKKKDYEPAIELPTLGKLCDAAVGDESNLHRSVELDLVFIPPDEVEDIWPLAEEFIEAGCAAGEASPEALKGDCEDGYAQLWLAWSDHCEAAAVTRIVLTPNGPVCVYESMGAKSLRKSNAQVAPKIEQWAKSQGCIAVRIYGRPGWSRAMPDYTLKWVCMDKEL